MRSIDCSVNFCKVCGIARLEEVKEYADLPRVTSDCKPWPAGGRLSICMSCGAAQKIADEHWLAEAAAIYRDYEIYHQSAGVEQGIFDPTSGASVTRSRRLADFLDDRLGLPTVGSVLDVGCGSGATLAAFSEVKNNWALYGYDLDDRRLGRLKTLANFRTLYTGDLSQISGEFSIATLVHATEHLPDPLGILCALRPRLGAEGRLFIQVPDYCVNPFDLTVADHLLHFSLDTLVRLVEAAGFAVEIASDTVIVKELTVVAKPKPANANKPYHAAMIEPSFRNRLVVSELAWLQSVIAEAERVAALGPLGIFGTSVAAAWIFGAVGDKIRFFVDEDPSRIGRQFMGRPILTVSEIPHDAQIYIPLAPVVAQNIKYRHRDLPVAFHLPPALYF